MKKRIQGVNDWKNCIKAGCYQYAIGFHSNEHLLVGDIIGKRCRANVSDDTLLHILKEELETLGYEVKEVEIDYQLKEGEIKIYLQRDEHSGYYHFLRQDESGVWSCKFPGEMPTSKDNNGKEIENPESMIKPPNYGWCFCLKGAS